METSDKIIIEELKRIILMLAQEITRLMKKIDVLERELARYTTQKTVIIAPCHLLRMRTGHHTRAVFGRKVVVKQEVNQVMKAKHWR